MIKATLFFKDYHLFAMSQIMPLIQTLLAQVASNFHY